MNQITLNYGKQGLAVELPDNAQADLIRKAEMPLLADPQAAVREALAAPLGAPPLAELARAATSACIRYLRHHPSGTQRAVPAAADRNSAGGRAAGRADHGAGRHRPAPAQSGR